MYILYLREAELIFGVIVLLFYEVMERHIVRYHDLNNAIRRLFTESLKSNRTHVFGVFFQERSDPDETSEALLCRILVLTGAKKFGVKISYCLRKR